MMHFILIVIQVIISSIALLLWIALATAGIVMIVCLVDGCQYGGSRYRDWRDPVFTFGGVGLFVGGWLWLTCLFFNLIR